MNISISDISHLHFANDISSCIDESAKVRGTGIARRSPKYIGEKIKNGNSIIAICNNEFAGFCYIERWEHGKYVAHSGLIVNPKFRGKGLAKRIKKKIFNLSKKKFPGVKIFGITTAQAVMKINSELGYRPVHFSNLTNDPDFWSGCQTCKNFDVLTRTERKLCLCTGMLYDPEEKKFNKSKTAKFIGGLFKRK